MLLIITNRSDLACDYLIIRLQELNIPFVRFNTDLYPDLVSLDIFIKNNKPYSIIKFKSGIEIKSNSISAVYFRQPKLPELKDAKNIIEKNFAETELIELLRSLWRIIPEKLWLNHPRNIWVAANKIDQLIAATSIGFSVPDTLLSYSINSIKTFLIEKNNCVIGKAIKHGFIRDKDKVLLAGTQRLSKKFIQELNNYAPIPMNYQEEIKKGLDYRVVVVGDNIFPTAISLKDCNEVDWRVADLKGINLVYRKIDVPKSIKQKCIAIVKHFKLNYSSIDLVQNNKGDFFFLELNPNGQWAWIEQLTGYPIRDTIINFLKGEKCGSFRD